MSFEYCHCRCHSNFGETRHIMPCCYQCRICKADIKVGAFHAHEKRCETRREELIAEIAAGLPLHVESKEDES